MDYIAEFNTKKNGSDDWPEVIDQAEVVEIGGQLNENSEMNDKSEHDRKHKPQSSQESNNSAGHACAFKIEKPKMPTFQGDIREYTTFRSDFKHIIGSRYNNDRDAITLAHWVVW